LEILKTFIIKQKNLINIINLDEKYIYLLKNNISNDLIIKVCYHPIKIKKENIVYIYKSKNVIFIYKLLKYNILNIDNLDYLIKLILFIDNIINLIKI
jgi:hypothetical protein